MLDILGLFLVVNVLLCIILAMLIFRKMVKIQHKDELSAIQELASYADNRQYDLTDENGMDALMIACHHHMASKPGEINYSDVVKKAVANGFDMNRRNVVDGKTPLMYAVRNHLNLETARYLLDAGANVNIVDYDGRTVLFDAVKRSGSKDFYNFIVDRVLNINHQDAFGITPLMIAAYEMNVDRVEDLLKRGADPKLKNNGGENAYDIARKYLSKHIQVVIESRNDNEGMKPQHITTSEDVLKAQMHNHMVREMVRRLECLVNDKTYDFKPFKRPFFNTFKAN